MDNNETTQNNNPSNPSSSSSDQQQIKPINELLSPTTTLQEHQDDFDFDEEFDQLNDQQETTANVMTTDTPSSSFPEPPTINPDAATMERIIADAASHPLWPAILNSIAISAASSFLLQRSSPLPSFNLAPRPRPRPRPPVIPKTKASSSATSSLRIIRRESHVIKKRPYFTYLRLRHRRLRPYVSNPADLLLMPPPKQTHSGCGSSAGGESLPKQDDDSVDSPRPQQQSPDCSISTQGSTNNQHNF